MRYINLLTYLITYFTYFTYPRRNSKLNSNYDQKQESQITQTHRAYADVCVWGGVNFCWNISNAWSHTAAKMYQQSFG